MKQLPQLTIRQKTMATLVITIVIAGLVSVQAYFDNRAIGEDIHNIYTRNQTITAVDSGLHHRFEEAAADLIKYALVGDAKTRQEALDQLTSVENILNLAESVNSKETRPRLKTFRGDIQQLRALLDRLHDDSNPDYAALNKRLIMEEIDPLIEHIDHSSDEVLEAVMALQNSKMDQAMEDLNLNGLYMAGFILGGALFVLLLNFLINRNILQRIDKVIVAMEGISEGTGQLSQRLEVDGKDEITRLSTAFNNFAAKIQNVINLVMESSTVLAREAQKMSDVSVKTRHGAEQQKAEIDNIADAIKGISHSVNEVAQSASAAAQATQDANGEAQSGRDVVTTTISSIEELSNDVYRAAESMQSLVRESENINSVLLVINEIADQTNLLALNAAIEAARAGEQGRGFAVVADEVRTLAIRTQESTEDIKKQLEHFRTCATDVAELMSQGRNKTQEVVEKATRAGDALRSINEIVANIAEMNANIASATDNQSTVVGEANQNISTISQIACETSEKAVQASASNHELSLMAVQLRTMVEQFLLDVNEDALEKETPVSSDETAGAAEPPSEKVHEDGDVTLF